MRNRILEIVVFIMDYLQQGTGGTFQPEEISDTLEQMGYSDGEIDSAYKWMLDRINDTPETYFSKFPKEPFSHRILTATERQQISSEAYGFLLKLRNLSLLNDEQLEAAIERAIQLGNYPVAEHQMKVLVSSVVFPDLGGMIFESSANQPVTRKKSLN
ncbi:MAG: DUF494 family protein [Candidatus Zixiibacteriota bacterium]